MKTLMGIFLGLTVATPLFGGTTQCSSPDQKVFYSESIRDVGIQPPEPLKTAYVLKLGKKVLLQKNVVDAQTGEPKPDIERGSIEVVQTLPIDAESIEKSGVAESITHDLRKAIVRRDTKEVFQGIIHCRQHTIFVP